MRGTSDEPLACLHVHTGHGMVSGRVVPCVAHVACEQSCSCTGAEWLPSLAKLGGVAAFGRARPAVLRSLAAKLAVQVHRCDAALRVLYRQGALGARGALPSRLQLQVCPIFASLRLQCQLYAG